ncbi:hypothetical protein HNV12_01120 [Methanococcoides sp. SA1]|nr:hypothetical protein [Methanococcoides sp. SA1]
MDRNLRLKDDEIFLFGHRIFHENEGWIKRAASRIVTPADYACTSNLIVEEGVVRGRLFSTGAKGLAYQIKTVHGSDVLDRGAKFVSDKDFRNEYSIEGTHGEVYDIFEFGFGDAVLKSIEDELVSKFK